MADERVYTPKEGSTVIPSEEKGYTIEVLKDGSIVEVFDLHGRDHWMFGRNADVCDYPLQHPSISRQHAVLEFNANNTWQLIDFSSHGTFVNRTRCEKGVHTEVNIGDFIKFGESSRMFIVSGPVEEMPEEYNSENTQRFRQKLAKLRERNEEKKKLAGMTLNNGTGNDKNESADEPTVDEDNCVSWGFMEDAEDDVELDDSHDNDNGSNKNNNPLANANLSDLPEYLLEDAKKQKAKDKIMSSDEVNKKDMKVYEKIRSRQFKIENMELEISRIRKKEGSQGGLSSGQEAQIARNEQAMLQTMEQIKNYENQIRDKNDQRIKTKSGGKTTSKPEEFNDDDDLSNENDDFYDRTKSGKLKRQKKEYKLKAVRIKKTNKQNALTAGQLEEKIRVLQTQQIELSKQVEVVEQEVAESKTVEETLDPLDAFMKATNDTKRQQSIRDFKRRIKDLKNEEERNLNLLEIAKPRMEDLSSMLVKSKKIETNQKAPSLPTIEVSSIIMKAEIIPNSTPTPTTIFTPTPTTITTTSTSSCTTQNIATTTTTSDIVPEKPPQSKPATHVTSTTVAAVSTTSTTTVDGSNSSNRSKREYKELIESSSSITSKDNKISENPDIKSKRRKILGPKPPATTKIKDTGLGSLGSIGTLEGGEVEWVAPEGQTGDGITELNAKYGY